MAVVAPVMVVGIGSPHVVRFVRGLLNSGESVALVTDDAAPFREFAALRIEVVNLSTRAWRAAATIRACIRRWRPMVIHAHQADGVGWHTVRGARGSGVPVVLTIWGSDVLLTPKRSRFHRWMVRQALLGSAGWTADALMLLEAARGVAGSRATSIPQVVIPLGVDAIPSPPLEFGTRRQLLSCRLHKPLYRIDAIIEAFAQLPASQAAWELEVAGSGSETPRLRALASHLGVLDRVHFTGFLDAKALAASYLRSAVFVSFPTSDGTSVSLLEAMAAGCVPVVSSLPANREWIVDGLNGRLADTPADLAGAMSAAVEWSQSAAWSQTVSVQNRALVERKALFENNIRQFIAFQRSMA